MSERQYSWPSDSAEKAYYNAQLQQQQQLYPAAPLCPDYNNNNTSNSSSGTLRYFNGGSLSMPSLPYTVPPGSKCPASSVAYVMPTPTPLEVCQYTHANGSASFYNRNRYMPYPYPYNHNRACAAAAAAVAVNMSLAASSAGYSYQPIYQQTNMSQSLPRPLPAVSGSVCSIATPMASSAANTLASSSASGASSVASSSLADSSAPTYATVTDPSDAVTLQITNLDYSLDEASLRNFLMNQLKPITPVVSLIFEGSSYAKVTVPDLYFAKQVVSNLHRKKIGHKRMLVSYTRDSSLTEVNTLRCQVAGLLKDVPYYTLPMYKFRELFQSRFKTSISVLDLYKMQDICAINSDNNEDKFISLQPELISSLASSPLMEGLQHSVPYCTVHFKREQHKGWAEQDIEPLPNVCMTIAEIQQLIYPLLKHHPGDIPVATLVHCIEGQLQVQIAANENGVNLEHLVSCVQGIQIQVNNFGIKILGWLELNKEMASGAGSAAGSNASLNLSSNGNGGYFKNSVADPLCQISREVIELVKMSPKSTMKFNRFIPAYHNHFGKQCRVADYGYTKLIELFEALSTVVQIMGDGENRQITLTHRTQIRRFTSDLLRVLRANGNNSVLLSQLPGIFAQTQNRTFDVTDYGVCDIVDILDGLVNSNIVVVSAVQQGKDILISIPKRKQTNSELERTCVFAGEMVELFRNALQYTILFQKFVRSYHYHFAYQCRLSDYGFLKLADLMEAIHGVVEIELTSDEDKKIYLSPKVARRVFAEQCEDLIRNVTGNSTNCMKMDQVLKLHKKKYGYQMLPQTLGVSDLASVMELLPYVEVVQKEQATWIICHNDDVEFRQLCNRACKLLLQREPSQTDKTLEATKPLPLPSLSKAQFLREFNAKHKVQLGDSALQAMRHAIEIYTEEEQECVRLTSFTRFLASIVRVLEQRPSMYLHELKTALECGIATTFEFGFPNLYSVIAAHEDLFTINKGPSQDRSDVSLNVHCELRLSTGSSHQHLFGSLKLPYAKHKARSVRTPLGEHNRPPPTQAPPPHKTRAIANEYVNSVTNGAAAYKPQVKLNTSHNFQAYQEQFAAATAATSMVQKCSPPFTPNCSQMQPSANSSAISSGLLNNSTPPNLSLCSSCNKENSLNSSLQLFNSSFNSSSELNGSLCANLAIASSTGITATPYGSSSKLWQRRQANYFQQQPAQPAQQSQHVMPGGNFGEALLPLPMQSSVSDLYDLVSCSVAPISSIYEPPKPDTPPTDLPFWIDPIWSNQPDVPQQPKNNLLNIRLPELKALNVMPMLLSPYTISKHENMKRQLFNFDNHDRKIA